MPRKKKLVKPSNYEGENAAIDAIRAEGHPPGAPSHQYFWEQESPHKTIQMSLRLKVAEYRAFRAICEREGKTNGEMISKLLNLYLDRDAGAQAHDEVISRFFDWTKPENTVRLSGGEAPGEKWTPETTDARAGAFPLAQIDALIEAKVLEVMARHGLVEPSSLEPDED